MQVLSVFYLQIFVAIVEPKTCQNFCKTYSAFSYVLVLVFAVEPYSQNVVSARLTPRLFTIFLLGPKLVIKVDAKKQTESFEHNRD